MPRPVFTREKCCNDGAGVGTTASRKPQSASLSEMVRLMNKSSPLRLKSWCACSRNATITSPDSPSSISSDLPENGILCPSGAPLGTYTCENSQTGALAECLDHGQCRVGGGYAADRWRERERY